MAGRGATTFQKRQKEQNRKEKRQDKLGKRLQKREDGTNGPTPIEEADALQPLTAPLPYEDDIV